MVLLRGDQPSFAANETEIHTNSKHCQRVHTETSKINHELQLPLVRG